MKFLWHLIRRTVNIQRGVQENNLDSWIRSGFILDLDLSNAIILQNNVYGGKT